MSVAVVFLARGVGAGLPSAQAFFDSYFSRRPGCDHQLYVLAKGWDTVTGLDEVEALAARAAVTVIKLPDDGYDWGAYFRFATTAKEEWLCFLNSHSRIQHDNWLQHLMRHALRPNVGMVGSTGSWSTIAPVWRFNWPRVKDAFHYRGLLQGCAHFFFFYLFFSLRYALRFWRFPSFPNPHLRSNAFLIRADLFRAFIANRRIPRTKMDAFELESGYQGLTRFVVDQGFSILVVGLDGQVYGPESWIDSRAFRVPDQHNLLIADNQTEFYKNAPVFTRRKLELSAWGLFFTE